MKIKVWSLTSENDGDTNTMVFGNKAKFLQHLLFIITEDIKNVDDPNDPDTAANIDSVNALLDAGQVVGAFDEYRMNCDYVKPEGQWWTWGRA